MTYRADIDGLRAVAILCVVLFHAFPAKLQGGFIGVDIFFVISGFLISSIIVHSLMRNEFSFAQFYAKRAKRIFPALLAMLCGTYAFGWFALLPDEFAQLGKHIAASTTFLQNLVLYQEAGYFDVASDFKPLMHLWSLAIEEQFYLLYPLLLWAAWRAGLNVLAIMLVLALGSFALNVLRVQQDPNGTFFFAQTRFWELLAGAILAYLQLFRRAELSAFLQRSLLLARLYPGPEQAAKRVALLNNLLASLGAGLLAAGLLCIDKGSLFPGWYALLPVGGTLLLILAGPAAWLNRTVMAHPLMVAIGLISYPLYLWHWPILSFARILEMGEPNRWVIVAAVAASFLLAWLTYRLLELPLRRSRIGRSPTAWASTALVVVGVVGITTFKQGGMAERAGMQALARQNHGVKFEDFAWDTSASKYGECSVGLTDDEPKIGYCSVSKPGKTPSIALIGDSHADAIFQGIAKNDDRSWLLIGNYGCPPVTDVNVRASYGNCEDLMEKAVDYVANNRDITTVVLSFFASYVLDTHYPHHLQENGSKSNGVSITSDASSFTSKPELFYFGLERTVSQLEAAGKQVLITIDTPELPFSPRHCIDRPLAEKNIDCVVARRDVEQRQAVHRALLQRLVQAHPNTKLYDPIGLVCDAALCQAIVHDVTVYRDAHHLSLRGSDLYSKNFLPWLNTNQHGPRAQPRTDKLR
ncbi:acyltransferase family protein [Pseudomonas turukhanskensis]|uniref:Acyltransferase n=1 Tax=Pseudomonas turukhanskensis TaxID=1806536 RepID=A0A9W6K5B4_9PSED|nr:acyltransferase family protein [Pseudomonas turukhanskensis]GLK88536.1 acyltransferase [Pseudomonas turukhanskensis]